MKIFKKAFAVILAVITALGIFAVSASAAPAAPKFVLKIKNQTSSSITFVLSLVSGSFNSIDLRMDVSGPIGTCEKIVLTDEFKAYRDEVLEQGNGNLTPAKNEDTAKAALASIKSITKATSIWEFTFKKSAKDVSRSDYRVIISSCVLSTGKTDYVDFTKDAEVATGYIDFKEESISANYKQTKKIDFDSNYSAKEIKWESSNTKVATVDENGNVKMTGKGTATITAKSADGVASAECKVTVKYAWWQWIIKIVLLGFLWY